MFCIINKRANGLSKTVYHSFNQREALEMVELLALDFIVEKQGIEILNQPKNWQKKIKRGLFSIAYPPVDNFSLVKVFEKKRMAFFIQAPVLN